MHVPVKPMTFATVPAPRRGNVRGLLERKEYTKCAAMVKLPWACSLQFIELHPHDPGPSYLLMDKDRATIDSQCPRFNDVSPEQKGCFGAFALLRLAIFHHWPRNFTGSSRGVASSPMQARKNPCPAGDYCTNHACRIRKYRNLAQVAFMRLFYW